MKATPKKDSGKGKPQSIQKRIFLPLLLSVFFQIAVMVLVFYVGGVFSSFSDNLISVYDQKTKNRASYLKSEMVNKWSNLDYFHDEISKNVERVVLDDGGDFSLLKNNNTLDHDVLAANGDILISMLRKTGTTGVFIIIDKEPTGESRQPYPCLYISDQEPATEDSGNSDLMLKVGPAWFSQQYKLALDVDWLTEITLSDTCSSDDFLSSVMAESSKHPFAKASAMGRWTKFSAEADHAGKDCLVYTMPIICQGKNVIGVMGVEVSVDYLKTVMPYDELMEGKKGVYALASSSDGGNNYSLIAASGPFYSRYMEGSADLKQPGPGISTSVQRINLYDKNSPYDGEEYFLIAMVGKKDLMSPFLRLMNMFGLTVVILGICIMLISFLVGASIIRPILRLSKSVKESNPLKPISLERTNIAELDDLGRSVEYLSGEVSNVASRISRIIDMSKVPVGVFEFVEGSDEVLVSKGFNRIIGLPFDESDDETYIAKEDFLTIMENIIAQPYPERENVFQLDREGDIRWISLFDETQGKRRLGTIIDVTDDIKKFERAQYELDFDSLTGIYNRRAFSKNLKDIFENRQSELGVAAVLMMDLDNLKYINDIYGHDAGDNYIRVFAKSMELFFADINCIVARRSGDEFYVFFYGFESKAEILEAINDFFSQMQKLALQFPGGGETRIRVSGGISWYPEDSTVPDELIQYADFAMYTVKHTTKGVFTEFSMETYDKDSIMIKGPEELSRIIEMGLVKYALQPIVSAADGSLFGYEFLMRPQSVLLKSPLDVIRLAKTNSQLSRIERLTWFSALEAAHKLTEKGEIQQSEKLFINSISNHVLTEKDFAEIERNYGYLLSRLIIEITESEDLSVDMVARKRAFADKYGAPIALDDFSAGFNRDASIIRITPDIIKVDITITTNIERDPSRRKLVESLVDYASSMNIHVLAEGVETKEQMETLISLGVTYLQGYYIAAPNFKPPEIPESVRDEIIAAAGSL